MVNSGVFLHNNGNTDHCS